ncbi:MAG TPA: hypothetical protein DCX46_02560 [Bacteroidetes bacterium]|nr:hypothetical protein [Bacteroidota bacterium]
MSTALSIFTDNTKEFLKFMKSRYTLIHQSNVFFRDVHYAVMAYLELNKVHPRYLESEELTRRVIAHLEQQGLLRPIDARTWLVTVPEFKLPSSKPAAPAKPAPGAASRPAAPKPAAAPATPAAPAPQPPQGS